MNEMDNKKSKNESLEIYFTDFLKGLRRFWSLCLILAVLFAGAKMYLAHRRYAPLYTSSASFTIRTQNNTSSISGVSVYSFYYDSSTASQLTATFPYILKSEILQDAICNDMKLSALPAYLSASSVENSNLFTLSATGRDPQMTYDVLLSAIDNYPEASKYVVGNIRLEMIESPEVATAPSNSPGYLSSAFRGAMMGLILGLLWILIYTLSRKTIRTKDEIKNELNLDTLGVIPRVVFKRYVKPADRDILFTNEKINSEFLESFRVVRNTLLNFLEKDKKVFVVTSTAPGEGKTTTTINLALSLVALGKKVLLVDADMRHLSVIHALNLNKGEVKAKKVIRFKQSGDIFRVASAKKYGLDLLLPDTENAGSKLYFDSKNLKMVFDNYRNEYDCILVDTPPCGLVSDTLYTAQQADGVIYVIHQDVVRVSKIRSGIDNLLSTDVNIIGCVLNGAIAPGSGYGYGYGYKYGYGYGYGYGYYGYGYGYGYAYGYKNKKKRSSSRKKRKASAE